MRIRRHVSMIWLHWATALLVATSFAIAWIRKDIDDLESRAFWLDVHRSIGFLVLFLTLGRLAWRFKVGALSRRADLPPAIWLASRITHGLLYAALIAMPLIGWAQSSAKAGHFRLFGVPVPRLVAHNRDLAETLTVWHENVAWLLLALIAVHAVAAIYHHYVRRDDLLRAMLPGYAPAAAAAAWPAVVTSAAAEVSQVAPSAEGELAARAGERFIARRRARG